MTELRDQLTETLTEWALTYPLANWPPYRAIVEPADEEQVNAMAQRLATRWGAQIADCVLILVQPEFDALDALARASALHQPKTITELRPCPKCAWSEPVPGCTNCTTIQIIKCTTCLTYGWPCDTRRALDGR